MKKITFILLALITGTAFGQNASEVADVNAQIVSPIKIENGTALNFGDMTAAGGGKVRVSTDGTRTFSNPEMEIASTTTVTAGSFDVTAAAGFPYNIHIPGIQLTETVTNQTMDVTFTHDLNGETGPTAVGSGSVQKLLVGGLLTVASGQASGVYSGEVKVTVAYQ